MAKFDFTGRNVDQDICTFIAEWIKQNQQLNEIVPTKMVFDYFRNDIPNTTNVAINIYPLSNSQGENGQVNRRFGWLSLDCVFSTAWLRTATVKSAIGLNSYILGQMQQSVSAPDFISYITERLGGIMQVGEVNRTSYVDLYDTSPNKTTVRTRTSLKYWINWELYQIWLQSFGCAIGSPNNVVYQPVTEVDINIQEKSAFNEEIN